MPNPTKKEKENKKGRNRYMNRCIPVVMKEGKSQDQAIAICSSMYQRSKKRKESKGDFSEPDFEQENELGIADFIPPV